MEGAAATLREGVWQAYSAIAAHPDRGSPFPTGRELALALEYPTELLDTLPAVAVEAFCGVSNVSVIAEIPAGARVLDLGCGAGLDTLIAARRAGRQGQVTGVDFSFAMLARAGSAVAEDGVANVSLLNAAAEALSLESASIDVVLVNGLFNLNPWREQIFTELARVVRPGGAVHASELVLRAPLPPTERAVAANWFT